MAARWGAGEETLTIGGMELFTAGGPLQCHSLEEHGSCDGLSDLALSSLDAGILGTFQGYIDNSIISIIDDNGAQAENKGHFDEENELSLLTALTEILDNADDENMSPFDSIPDSDLLVSPKDRDGSSKFLSLTRTPPDREISMDDQRRVGYAKVDVRCAGPNWDLFPDAISSTPKRRSRCKGIRACLPRRAITEQTLQRSDGEEEDDQFTEKLSVSASVLLSDKDVSMDPEEEIGELDSDSLMAQDTPCIINTENVADLVKHMHPYCLPALKVCIDPEDEEDLLDEAVFLEVVSEQGETIKVPVILEHPVDFFSYQSSESSEDMPILESIEKLDGKQRNWMVTESTSEQCVPELELNTKKIDNESLSEESSEPTECNIMESMPILEKMYHEPTTAERTSNVLLDNVQAEMISKNDKESELNSKPNDKLEGSVPNPDKEKSSLKGKKASKNTHSVNLRSKVKGKNKGTKERSLDVKEMLTSTRQLSNSSLKESDLLIKTLDQVKESQMELRSSKVYRCKTRSRPSLENSEKKINENVKREIIVDNEQPKPVVEVEEKVENVDLNQEAESFHKSSISDQTSGKDLTSVVSDSNLDCTSNSEEKEPAEQVKEIKPKLLSLSEYRKRLQNRKPNAEKENENLSCSKWPSIPEPPTELAELPCLIPVPAKANKTVVEEKQTPHKSENSIAPDVPVNSNPMPAVPMSPEMIQDVRPQKPVEEPCPAAMDTNPPPMTPSHPNIPPPFFPPAWSTIPSHPPFFPGLPHLPTAPPFPNAMPPMMSVQPPPPVMNWPPFPPPPIAMGPVQPNGWVPGMPPPFWANPQVPQGVLEPPIAFSLPNMLPEQRMPQESLVPSVVSLNPPKQSPLKKTEHGGNFKKGGKLAKTTNGINQNKSPVKVSFSESGPQVSSNVRKSDALASAKSKSSETNMIASPAPDLNAANQMVMKIMEILKKAQKCGFQINLPLPSSAQTSEMSSGGHKPMEVSGVKPTEPKHTNIVNDPTKEQTTATVAKLSTTPAEQSKHDNTTPVSFKAVKDLQIPPTVNAQPSLTALAPVELCTPQEALNSNLHAANQKEHAESLETGIEASDLTSLLEEFEKSEAKDERLPHSPDKLAVGNSGTEETVEKSPLERPLPPELVNTAGLTPPATPPHQLWKTVSGNLNGKTKPLHENLQEKQSSSPLKTAKLIEPKPLPPSKLKNRNIGADPSVAAPHVHVASGDHDYCILSVSYPEKETIAAENKVDAVNPPCQMEEGSRWNVKHHKNIIIKPILQFSKLPQSKTCSKQSTANAPPAVCNQNPNSGLSKTVSLCRNSPKETNDPLDHRTNDTAESAIKCPPGSVLMSPDTSPCRSVNGEVGTVEKENTSGSRRAFRCYRRYRNSPSPPTSPWRGRSSNSCSDSSSSSSSSRSRSRSPPSKRRRTRKSRSHHRSRSSSMSSCSSRSSSRFSSPSSRSCSPSSSRCRSRSRSPYRRRYRSRSRRCESRDSYYRQKMYHKERAIEERRVVYIGKINSQMTRTELRRRFSVFGDIEECTVHFREHGDNYGFVTYNSASQAFAAIENGHKLRLPDELPFDLCFGGRRQFCKRNYADLDSNLDDFDPAPIRSKFESLDFDTLLKQAQKSMRR
ncbi:peroxisome proliferator-activated receptor gamma coactivator-related protein 1 [Gastrophryne carolinensis]